METALTNHQAHNAPDPMTALQIPRLWSPGLVFVTLQGDLRLGRSAGYSSHDMSFRRLCCGYRSKIEHWTHVAWLVSRRDLSRAVVAEHAIVLPEALIDREAQPHAHRWLWQQPLVCVSGSTWQRLAAAGVRVFRVACDGTGDRVLDVQCSGGPTAASSLRVGLEVLEIATLAASGGRLMLDVQGDPSPVDRVLRLVSGGALDESSVLNAFDARCLIEDGYGYRGALEGHFIEMADLARRLEPVDLLFGQIFERATTMRAVALRLLEVLAQAMPEATQLSVPLYGAAHGVDVPALCLPPGEQLVLGGQREQALELPPERRWTVEGVDTWSPRLPLPPA